MIPYGRHHVDEEDIQAVVDILRNGALTQGPVVQAFAEIIADYVGAKYAVAVSSGTAGLHLAALAAGVGPGQSLVLYSDGLVEVRQRNGRLIGFDGFDTLVAHAKGDAAATLLESIVGSVRRVAREKELPDDQTAIVARWS